MIHDSAKQSEQTTANLKLGCYGWNHAHWAGRYYPDDLPEDWRLSYYANDYSCVLVPANYCLQDDIEDWLDEVHETFKFFMEWPQAIALQQQVILAGKKLQSQLGGIVIQQAPIEMATQVRHVAQFFMQHTDTTKKIWQPEVSYSSGVGLLDSINNINLRQQRVWLEAFDAASAHQAQNLFIKDTHCDHRQLDDMAKLIELLGY